MKGSIRIILGLLIVYGAVGTLDYDPGADLLVQTLLALGGLGIMLSGILANQKQQNG